MSAEKDCPKCFGLGKEVDGDREYVCPCIVRNEERQADELTRKRRILFNLRAAHIPKAYSSVSLDSAQPRAGQEAIQKAVKAWDGKRGLVLCGGVRKGKTHFASALLRSRIEAGDTGIFMSVSALFLRLRASFGAPKGDATYERESDIIAPLLNRDVVLLDDLGVERPSEYTDSIFYHVVNERCLNLLPILATSNFLPEARDEKLSLPHRLGARVFERLRETCDFVEI